jgi:hypothetical protein
MNRRFLLPAVVIMLGFAVADAVATSFTLGELYERPVTLVQDERRVEVFLPTAIAEMPARNDMAVLDGSAPRYFGHIHVFETQTGDRVVCDHVFYWMWCERGSSVEREETTRD